MWKRVVPPYANTCSGTSTRRPARSVTRSHASRVPASDASNRTQTSHGSPRTTVPPVQPSWRTAKSPAASPITRTSSTGAAAQTEIGTARFGSPTSESGQRISVGTARGAAPDGAPIRTSPAITPSSK